MSAPRQALNRRLWAMVRHMPGGEQTLRDLVVRIHQEDGTGHDLGEHITSTKTLTDGQFARLLTMVSERAPNQPRRRRSRRKYRPEANNVVYMATAKERDYIEWLATGALGWSQEALVAFIQRQTKGKGVGTHDQATAVIEPLERILQRKGWTCREEGKDKTWLPPVAKEE